MKIQKKAFIEATILILLFFVAPFLQSITDVEAAETFSINILPEVVATIASYIRWFLFFLILVWFLFRARIVFHYFTALNLLIISFYLVQAIYALVSMTEVSRFLGLASMCLVLPVLTTYTFSWRENLLLKILPKIIYLFVIGAIVFNIGMVFTGMRFQGFINNSNLYGFTAVFWLALLLMTNKKQSLIQYSFIGLILITILLTGSRNAMMGAVLVVVLSFKGNWKSMLLPLLIFIVAILFLITTYDLQFVTGRLLNIENSYKDSGRIHMWENAMSYINRDFLWGQGMDSNITLLNTGNLHNGYLRYVLSMGLLFTLFSFTFYFIFLFKLFLTNFKKIPGSLLGFILAFTLANLGEDYFFGLGSSVFIYFCIAIGLISYFLLEGKLENKGFFI